MNTILNQLNEALSSTTMYQPPEKVLRQTFLDEVAHKYEALIPFDLNEINAFIGLLDNPVVIVDTSCGLRFVSVEAPSGDWAWKVDGYSLIPFPAGEGWSTCL